MELHSVEVNKKNVHRLFVFIFIHMTLFLLLSVLLSHYGITVATYGAATGALLPLLFVYFKEGYQNIKTYATEKMTIKAFLMAFVIMLGINFIAGTLVSVLVYFLKMLGLPMPNLYQEVENLMTTSKWIILYGLIAGPVVEEVVFRGVLFGVLEKYGKTTALIVSSLIFGLMHDIFEQSISTFFIGLVFGVICMRYGLIYSILFHILNNGFVFLITTTSSDSIQTGSSIALFVAAVLTVIWYVRDRQKVHAWFRLGTKELTRVVKGSPFFWVVVCSHIFLILLGQLSAIFPSM